MIYNIIVDNNNIDQLHLNMFNKVLRDNQDCIIKNQLVLHYFNSKPCVSYINTKNHIHLILLERGHNQSEYIIKQIKIGDHLYKYELKTCKQCVNNTAKALIDKCINKNDMNIEPITINLIEVI